MALKDKVQETLEAMAEDGTLAGFPKLVWERHYYNRQITCILDTGMFEYFKSESIALLQGWSGGRSCSFCVESGGGSGD